MNVPRSFFVWLDAEIDKTGLSENLFCEKAGPHAFRHTAGTWNTYLNDKADTQEMLGHTTGRTTDRYVHTAKILQDNGIGIIG